MTTITLPRAIVEQALEALKDDQYRLVEVSPNQYEYKTDLAIAALERALAQQAEPVEPVATLHDDGCFTWKRDEFRRLYEKHRAGWRMDVFAAPPKLVPLTDEEIQELSQQHKFDSRMVKFVRIIERAHGIGDNT